MLDCPAVLVNETQRCCKGLNLVPDGLRNSESLVPTHLGQNFAQEHSLEIDKNKDLTSGCKRAETGEILRFVLFSEHKTFKTQFKQDLYQDFHILNMSANANGGDLVMLQLNSSKYAIIDEIAMQVAFRFQFQRNPKEIELVQLHTRSRT